MSKVVHNGNKRVVFAVGLLVAVILALLILLLFNRNKSDTEAVHTTDNSALLSSCLNKVDSSNDSNLSLLYEQAKLPNNNSESSLLDGVKSRISDDQNCFKQYPVTYTTEQNSSLQQSCIKNSDDYYSQYVGLAKAQMLDPYQFPDASTYLLGFQDAQNQAEQNCKVNYP